MDDPLIVAISMERVWMRLILSTHGDARPTKLFDGDERFLEVPVFGKDMGPEVHGKVLGDENIVRHLG